MSGGRRLHRWLVVLVLTAPLASPARAFRGLADDPAIGGETVVTWSSAPIAIELAVGPLGGAQGAFVEAELQHAFAAWHQPVCSSLRFAYSSGRSGRATAGDGRNTVEWVGEAWSARGFEPDVAATTDVQLVRVDGGGWSIAEADVYLNGVGVRWQGIHPGGVDLRAVLIHELGHVLGLLHPCELDGADGAPLCESGAAEDRTSVLYPVHAENTRTLSADDVDGLCTLYPTAECDGADCGLGLVCVSGACRTPDDAIACGADPDPCLACTRDDECVTGRFCGDRACIELRDLGERCSADAECAEGMCAEGACSVSCATPTDCADGFDCIADGWCRARAFSRDRCETAEECVTALCLVASTGTRTCTSPCSTSADCLVAEECAAVSGVSVCQPAPASGCSAARLEADTAGDMSAPLFLLLLLLLLSAIRRPGPPRR